MSATDELIAYLHMRNLDGHIKDVPLLGLLDRVRNERKCVALDGTLLGYPIKVGPHLKFVGGPLDGFSWPLQFPADKVLIASEKGGVYAYECHRITRDGVGNEDRDFSLSACPEEYLKELGFPP